jgi:hypothetical protein
MPSDGTIGGLVGKLDVLRLECPTCGRQGRYHVARLLEELGPGARLTESINLEAAVGILGRKLEAGVSAAEPGALGSEPLEAAISGDSLPSLA